MPPVILELSKSILAALVGSGLTLTIVAKFPLLAEGVETKNLQLKF